MYTTGSLNTLNTFIRHEMMTDQVSPAAFPSFFKEGMFVRGGRSPGSDEPGWFATPLTGEEL